MFLSSSLGGHAKGLRCYLRVAYVDLLLEVGDAECYKIDLRLDDAQPRVQGRTSDGERQHETDEADDKAQPGV